MQIVIIQNKHKVKVADIKLTLFNHFGKSRRSKESEVQMFDALKPTVRIQWLAFLPHIREMIFCPKAGYSNEGDFVDLLSPTR
jgi:hypothetical protein